MTAHASFLSPRIARGGKAIYGAPLGILMLDARFPRIPGDMGNGATWPFPVLYKVVPGATPDRVVRQKSQGLANAFLDAAAELVELGAEPHAASSATTPAASRPVSAVLRAVIVTVNVLRDECR